jgi:hypothetical protein
MKLVFYLIISTRRRQQLEEVVANPSTLDSQYRELLDKRRATVWLTLLRIPTQGKRGNRVIQCREKVAALLYSR